MDDWIYTIQRDGYGLLDVSASLPSEWATLLMLYANEAATHVVKHGRGPGSLEEEETAGLDYRVVTGKQIIRGLPWLHDWYSSFVLSLWIEATGQEIRIDDHAEAAININVVSGMGGRYELHTDSALSAILFASTLTEEDGGSLEIHLPFMPIVRVHPQAGLLVLFDGSTIPHAVQPLTRETTRYSVPMNFLGPAHRERNPKLSEYIYAATKGA